MSRRFNSETYLHEFASRRVFPEIHNSIASMILGRSRSVRILDLCCSTGLLGQRLVFHGGFVVTGLEADPKASELAQRAGVTVPIVNLAVNRSSLDQLGALITANQITAVAARRCLPEILGDDEALDGEFASTLARAGVREVFLEGRIVGPRTVHRLGSVDDEIRALASHFDLVSKVGRVAFLRSQTSVDRDGLAR